MLHIWTSHSFIMAVSFLIDECFTSDELWESCATPAEQAVCSAFRNEARASASDAPRAVQWPARQFALDLLVVELADWMRTGTNYECWMDDLKQTLIDHLNSCETTESLARLLWNAQCQGCEESQYHS